MEMFWENGYEGTSMNDLAAVTGMAKPGLYATFGDKEAIYTKALSHYFQKLGAPLFDDMRQSDDPFRVVIRRHLANVAAASIDKSSPGGCFLVNSVVECASRPQSLDTLTRTFDTERRSAFIERFRAAKKQGELPPDCDDKALAEFFAGQSQALAVMGRAGADRKTLDRFIDVAMTVLPPERA